MQLLWILFLVFYTLAVADQSTSKEHMLESLAKILSKNGGKFDKEWQKSLDDTIKQLQDIAEAKDQEWKKNYKPVDIKLPGYKIPIVFVYTVSKTHCESGIPHYIMYSVQQALLTQRDSELIFISNYKECPKSKSQMNLLGNIVQVDTDSLVSERFEVFRNRSVEIFQSDATGNDLWVSSALRLFQLESLMITHNLAEVMHIEADNMLYGSLSHLIDVFRKGYRNLAATPLNTSKTFITASVLWIANPAAIRDFNSYLLAIVTNTMMPWKLPSIWGSRLKELIIKDEFADSKGKPKAMWDLFLSWIRPHSCCKKRGGIQQNSEGKGIRPYAINEMSLMAFYHELYPDRFQLLPVLPVFPYIVNRHVINITIFAPGGSEVGPDTNGGIWDPNSWGQFMGGTSSKGGRDKGFTDSSHMSGLAIRMGSCKPHMICGRKDIHKLPLERVVPANGTSAALECYTAPHVRCGNIDEEMPGGALQNAKKGDEWVHLYNLHVHSKHTENYISQPCECGL